MIITMKDYYQPKVSKKAGYGIIQGTDNWEPHP